jgi:TatD DNase family protein
MLIDTHCHIHEHDFPLDRGEVLAASMAAGVGKIICVGTEMKSSRDVVKFVSETNSDVKIYATLGVHPHEVVDFTMDDLKEMEELAKENQNIVVGIGEIGLDYFYEFAPRDKQTKSLEMQLDLAQKLNLPISFHVRDGAKNGYSAFDDFWAIFDNFSKLRGVLHSYTDQHRKNLDKALERGLYFGVNGIATFAKESDANLWRDIPLHNMLLETDAPFLAPVPFRGQTNQPSLIPKIVESLAELRGEPYEIIAKTTTENAQKLFSL